MLASECIATQRMRDRKLEEFEELKRSIGPGIINTVKVPLTIESSGAWSDELKLYWKELKCKHKDLKRENYIRLGVPYTWSAFTFTQYWPQRLSFAIAKHTAEMVMEGLSRARHIAAIAA